VQQKRLGERALLEARPLPVLNQVLAHSGNLELVALKVRRYLVLGVDIEDLHGASIPNRLPNHAWYSKIQAWRHCIDGGEPG
jgi:hypothetical protein